MGNVKRKRFFDDDTLRVATKGIFPTEHRAVIGARKTTFAILLLAICTGWAMTATINHAPNTSEIAYLKSRNLIANSSDATDNLMTGYRRINRVFPFVARGMQVRMTDAAIQNVYLNIVWI